MGSGMDAMLAFNQRFVADKEYEKYAAHKLPDKKLAVLACMDTRLTELLPAALDFKNGDIKLIKNAGAIISHPFGSAMRSLLVCVFFMNVEEIAVIGHYDCGMQGFDTDVLKRKMKEKGVSQKNMDMIKALGVDMAGWFKGFEDSAGSVRETVTIIRNHPLIPEEIRVRGFLIDPRTGAVEQITTDD